MVHHCVKRFQMYMWAATWQKQQNWVCAQRRLRSAWASAQSYKRLRCALIGYLRAQVFFMRTTKALIRLGGCQRFQMYMWAATWQNQQNESAPSEDRCALIGYLRTQAFFMRTAKTLIRLGGCPGWSKSSLGAHSFFWFCHVAANIF